MGVYAETLRFTSGDGAVVVARQGVDFPAAPARLQVEVHQAQRHDGPTNAAKVCRPCCGTRRRTKSKRRPGGCPDSGQQRTQHGRRRRSAVGCWRGRSFIALFVLAKRVRD